MLHSLRFKDVVIRFNFSIQPQILPFENVVQLKVYLQGGIFIKAFNKSGTRSRVVGTRVDG